MIASSPDGHWIAIRHGDRLRVIPAGERELLEARSEPVTIGLPIDREFVFVGTPSMLLVSAHDPPALALHPPPTFEPTATFGLEQAVHVATITGPRVAFVTADRRRTVVARVVGAAINCQQIEHPAPIEFVVGLERNQLLFSLAKRLEVWDAITGRPTQRLAFQLPPPPRTVGAAHGHLWATQPGSDEITILRMSDGRPFRHRAPAPIDDAIASGSSPVIVLKCGDQLVRLHCFAHSLSAIDSPWQPGHALTQLVVGGEPFLLGTSGDEVWRVPIATPAASQPTRVAHAPPAPPAPPPTAAPVVATAATVDPQWRVSIAALAEALWGGAPTIEWPPLDDGCQLATFAAHNSLGAPELRALTALYGSYLIGKPAVPVATLARWVADWQVALGPCGLDRAHAVRRYRLGIELSASVRSFLDGRSSLA